MIEQAEAQFSGSLYAEDWATIRSAVLTQAAPTRGKSGKAIS